MKIYLSPSNQPTNTYCVGNTNEKAQMEALAGKVKAILDNEYVCETVMATLSMGIELTGRTTEAKNKSCEVYIAIHSNAGGYVASGAVGIYHPSQTIGKSLAENIVAELNKVCPIKSNRSQSLMNGMTGLNGGSYGEIRSPEQLGLVAVLIETNFHDNPKTAQYIIDSKDTIARAYVDGIVKTFGLVKKQPLVTILPPKLENIAVVAPITTFGIEYQAHVQGIGWQSWVKDGEIAGTVGKSLRIEAIRIKLVAK